MTISANYPTVAPSLDLDFANGQALDSRINFTRAGTGTYYDGETSALAEINFLLNSQDFTQWGKQQTTVSTSLVTAPNGTTTANPITATATNNIHIVQDFSVTSVYLGTTSTTVTASCYLKANGHNFASIIVNTASTANWFVATVDLSTGTITQTGNGATTGTYISSSSVSVGNGWYRVSVTGTVGGTNTFVNIGLNSTSTPTYGGFGNESWSAVGTESIYAWGAQLNLSTQSPVYVATTSSPTINYIPQLLTAVANQPRFDFNPVTRQSLGLLMEQQSTNLVIYSSDYTNAVWTKNNTSAVAATNISPDGTLNAQSIVENTATTTHQLQVGTSQASNTTVTASIFFKSNGRPVFNITVVSADFSGNFSAFFNATTGQVGTTASAGTGTFSSATMTSVGNGWYRCRISGQPSTTASTTRIHTSFGDTEALTTSGYTGNGTSGIYAWGAQLEATAFPTSYIPTVASTVTRAQDFATITGTNFSSWFNNQQGTVYCSFDMASIAANNMTAWNITNGLANGYFVSKETSTLKGYIISTSASLGSVTANTTQQSSYSFTNNPIAVSGSLNGATSVAVSSPTALSFTPVQLNLGQQANNNPMTGHIRKFAYYPIASTSAQLQALTGS